MSLESLDTCIAAYYLDSTGYNTAAGVLEDKSGYGHDLYLTNGTPAMVTRNGVEMMDLTGDWWFEGVSPLPPFGSVAAVGALSTSGADGTYVVLNTANSVGATEKDGVPPTITDWFASANQRRAIQSNSNLLQGLDRVGTASGWQSVTAGATFLHTAAFDVTSDRLEARTNGADATGSAFPSSAAAPNSGEMLRIGQVSASGSFSVGRYINLKRVYVFRGNILEHSGFTAAEAAEQARWQI